MARQSSASHASEPRGVTVCSDCQMLPWVGLLAVTQQPTPAGWGLLGTVLLALPLANAHLGIPWLRRRLAENGKETRAAWWVHRCCLVGAHVVLVGLAFLLAATEEDGLQSIGVRGESDLVGTALVCTVLFIAAMVLAARHRGTAPPDSSSLEAISRSERRFATLSVVWAGAGQELLFRTFAITQLEAAGVPSVVALGLTSLAFAYYHGGFSQGRTALAVNVSGGLWFGFLYLWSGRLTVVTVAHGMAVVLVQLAMLRSSRSSKGEDGVTPDAEPHSAAIDAEHLGDVSAAGGHSR